MQTELCITNPIGVEDVATLLDVSAVRVRQLDRVLCPVVVRGTRIYSRDSVLRYAADRDQRKAGAQ